ncbi:ABC transporter substrate-binding protein [Commensalibacter communis]|uniref:ABC transporter substrate-binding protein n=1 Tax=Commensalibacter communis TaxID=2972786 RepID=UPI0022FF8B67|nr:ABC transporter substrate-binding protein [Commensalibacter communis]CAI3949693.1 ABC-type nitrate/sulfonate/bicarbonate transport system [Commensalibacter communis]CAI3955160.1 ABC-type nitrate/sulfonate/bicarbonate transport system [Commensalibacter communis]
MNIQNKSQKSLITRRKTLLGLAGTFFLAGGGGYTSYHLITHKKNLIGEYKPQSIRIAWPKSEIDSLLTIAQTEDFFQNYGLNVTILPNIQNHLQALDAFKNNMCDATVLSVLDWLPNLLTGMQARLLVGISGGNFRLLVSKKSRIDRLVDLADLKIATRRHAEKERLFFSILLRRKGLNPERNIKWVEMEKEELLPALLSNQVQAIIGYDPFMWEILSNANKQIFELAGSQTGSWSSRANRILGINNQFLKKNPDIAVPLALSIRQSSKWQTQHLQETSILLADEWKGMNSKQILQMLKNENQNIAPINNQLWEQIAQYIDEFKLLGKVPNNLSSSRTARQFCLPIKT